jgi:simple sugar transport system permease protein
MRRAFLRSHEFVLLLILIGFSVLVSVVSRAFFTAENIFDILKSSSIMGTMAIGVFVVMLSGGIDLSFPAIATVSMYVSVRLLQRFQGNLPLAFLFAAVLGVAFGCINAFLIYRFKIPTLIVTLGTASIFHGAYLTLAKVPHIYSVPPYFFEFSTKFIFSWTKKGGPTIGLSTLTFMMLAIAVLTWLLLRFTMLGKGIYAIGGNPEAAKRAGFNIMRLQFFIYCYVGLLSGIASIQYVSLVRHVHPYNLMGMQLDVIAAVVLGGASLAGGTGTVLGTLLGVWMIYVIRNSLVLMRIPSYWDPVVIGLIIVASTAINAWRGQLRKAEVRTINA